MEKKDVAKKYLDQAIYSLTSDMSRKLALHKGGGGAVDIHKMIGKLLKPKAGWTPGYYKYMGPYFPLEDQYEDDKDTGDVTEWHIQH